MFLYFFKYKKDYKDPRSLETLIRVSVYEIKVHGC